MNKKLYVAYPLGFCAGVRRAVATVEAVLAEKSALNTVYVFNEIVHNTMVVEKFRARGVVFVHNLAAVPPGGVIIFSAHGVSAEIQQQAAARNLQVVDATCPLVTALHKQVQLLAGQKHFVVLIGHPNHPEVIGTLGQLPPDALKLVVENAGQVELLPSPKPGQTVSVLVQTTLNQEVVLPVMAAMRKKFAANQVELAGNRCYATENRQNAVRKLAEKCQHILVIGSPHSSNSRQLCEVAHAAGAEAVLVDDPSTLTAADFAGFSELGLSAGASAPPELLDKTRRILQQFGFCQVEELHIVDEKITFPVSGVVKA